ncbi:asc1-like protein [Phtheirospermum japonicum]|uniref:Asc1-like protein n=1 Tax=Phtheirospermum japonicum TaxID=374723 RepID=A0A830CR09_9LAMI|nr:asc1-like protein [Phtheirospermum japonicum]
MGFVEVVKSMEWEQESYPQYHDFIVLPFFVLFFPTLRFFLDRFVFEKVSRRLMFGKGMQVITNETDEQKKKIRKFKESAWKCVYFLSAEIFALAVTYNEPWFTNTNYEVIQFLDIERDRVYVPIYYYVFNTLLFSLLVLHIYWFVLMFRMLVDQVKSGGQVSEDVRSDSEDEDAHED